MVKTFEGQKEYGSSKYYPDKIPVRGNSFTREKEIFFSLLEALNEIVPNSSKVYYLRTARRSMYILAGQLEHLIQECYGGDTCELFVSNLLQAKTTLNTMHLFVLLKSTSINSKSNVCA